MSARESDRAADAGVAPILHVQFYRHFPSPPSRTDEEAGKFVLLTRREEIHMVLSPVAFTPYHANIVFEYLQTEGRGRVEGASGTGCRILSPEWAVRGGGYYTLQHWLHHLKLHGKSSAFGRFDESLLRPFLDDIPGRLACEGYTLEIE
jgi:hypothetical protein